MLAMTAVSNLRSGKSTMHRCGSFPPHSIEAEQSVIGGLLLDNARGTASPTSCTRTISTATTTASSSQQIVQLINDGKPADVHHRLREPASASARPTTSAACAYLNALAQNTPSAANIRRYAEIVRDRAILRKLITVADEISDNAFNPQGKEVKQMLDEAESKIFAIAEAGARGASWTSSSRC